MKTLVLTFGTIIAFIAGSTLLTSCGLGSQKDTNASEQHDMDSDHDHASESMAATFACSMHPEITGKEGDTCSKCGMALVAGTDTASEMKDMPMAATFACSMHPDITGLEGDKCSKCGMTLVLADASDVDHEKQ